MKLKTSVISVAMLLSLPMADAFACNSKANLRQGMAFANMQDFNGAINEFKASLACRKSAKAYSNLGAAYMQIGKPNLALAALKKAEKMNKNDNIILYNLAAAYSTQDKTDLSLTYLERALAKGFSNYDAIRFDPDLANLRGEPDFRSTLEKHKIFIQ